MLFTATTRSAIFATHRPAMPSMTWRRMTSTAPFREFPEFMERCMKPPNGLPPPFLASSVTEHTLVANSEERMRAILATLEQCRAALVKNTRPETAKLVALAILDLRIDLTHTSDAELKAL